MKTGVVSSADISAQPGKPLDAQYWLTSRPGESHEQWKRRQSLVRRLRILRRQVDATIAELAK